MSILAEIFDHKRLEVRRQREQLDMLTIQALAERAPEPLPFLPALKAAHLNNSSPALIAEIKRRSPSRGSLAMIQDPPGLAALYASQGAAAISVLTDEKYFGGSLDDLRQAAHRLPGTPFLRKDFICDPYQLYETRTAGGSAVLLIAAALKGSELKAMHRQALDLGLIPLVEIHSREELEVALECQPKLVGINNRDLRDFSVRLETTLELKPLIPAGVTVVAESGIQTVADVRLLSACGVDAILVGEALVTAEDIGAKTRELAGLEDRRRIPTQALGA